MPDIVVANPLSGLSLSPIELGGALEQSGEKAAKLRREKIKRAKTTKGEGWKERQGKDGKKWPYVDPVDAAKWLDKNFPGWSFQVLHETASIGDNIHVLCRLTVIDCGIPRIIEDYGSKEAIISGQTGKLTTHPYYKSAASDGLKRCCARLGFAANIYSAHDLDNPDDADASSLPSDEDILYYLDNILPVASAAMRDKPANIIKQVNMFSQGKVSLEKMKTVYKI